MTDWAAQDAEYAASCEADQHLSEAHGPVLTRSDLDAAEAEHAATCCACCRDYGHAHNSYPCITCGHTA